MRALTVDAVIRGPGGQVAVHVEPPDGMDLQTDLQFIYRAALGIYWNPAARLLEDRLGAIESSVESASRMAQALREEYGMALQPSDDMQWKDFGADERDEVASALFGHAR